MYTPSTRTLTELVEQRIAARTIYLLVVKSLMRHTQSRRTRLTVHELWGARLSSAMLSVEWNAGTRMFVSDGIKRVGWHVHSSRYVLQFPINSTLSYTSRTSGTMHSISNLCRHLSDSMISCLFIYASVLSVIACCPNPLRLALRVAIIASRSHRDVHHCLVASLSWPLSVFWSLVEISVCDRCGRVQGLQEAKQLISKTG